MWYIMIGPGSNRPRYITHTTVIVDVVSSQIQEYQRVTDMEKWVTLGTQLGYKGEQLLEFVKEQQTLEIRETQKKES